MESNVDPISIVEDAYLARKARNENYSLTAFARDLGTSTAQLSRILSRTRILTYRQAAKISAALQLSKTESSRFIQMTIQQSPKNAKVSKSLRTKASAKGLPLNVISYTVDRFRTIASWYDIAILNLSYVEDFDPSPEWIASRLAISTVEARDAIKRLTTLGLLVACPRGGLKSADNSLISMRTKQSTPELRKFNSDWIDKAKLELRKTSNHDFTMRLINGITFPCDPSFIPELKELIHEFQFKILAKIKNQKHQEVYRLNCQLFPLTKHTGEKNEK